MIAGSIAGLGRRNCVTCGSVQIDLRPHGEVGEEMSVFSARRPTLFTLRSSAGPEETEAVSAGFGLRRRRRRR